MPRLSNLRKQLTEHTYSEYLKRMYGVRGTCSNKDVEPEDLKLLIGLEESGVTCADSKRTLKVDPISVPNNAKCKA